MSKMSRLIFDEIAPDGTILNGYDYNLQVWVEDGVCLGDGLGKEYIGMLIKDVPGHEVRQS